MLVLFGRSVGCLNKHLRSHFRVEATAPDVERQIVGSDSVVVPGDCARSDVAKIPNSSQFLCRYGREIFTPNLGYQLILFAIAAVSFLRCGRCPDVLPPKEDNSRYHGPASIRATAANAQCFPHSSGIWWHWQWVLPKVSHAQNENFY